MTCKNCNTNVTEKMKFCPKCGTKLELVENVELKQEERISLIKKVKDFILANKKAVIIFLIALLVLVAIILFFIFCTPKLETLKKVELEETLSFTIGEEDYYLGEKLPSYKGLSYDKNYVDEDSYVVGNSIALQTFYKDDAPQFFATLHCPTSKNCKYDDANIIKINFYENSDVVVDDNIKFGMSYDEVVDEYGEEDGVFYQDESYLVWNFGEKGKVGETYMILEFTDGWFESGISDIRIGIWWYEGEYEHTVEEN